jgi:hypothetical protein
VQSTSTPLKSLPLEATVQKIFDQRTNRSAFERSSHFYFGLETENFAAIGCALDSFQIKSLCVYL